MRVLHHVMYGTSIIPFTIKYTDRKTLAIAVYPDRSVEITSPNEAPLEKILERVERRSSWILKKIRKYSKHDVYLRKTEWVSGESIYYLGRQYRLKVAPGKVDVKLTGKFLWVSVPDKKNSSQVKALVEAWYNAQAKKKYDAILQKNSAVLRRENIKLNSLMVRKLEKRWGSCSKKGNIILNTDLVKTPVDCINYVIVHELCHLKHMNHSKKFYQTLEKHLPGWQKTKSKLERYAGLI